ncbi:MAG TPA: DinB family protein [Terracidiphilus sp.]|nr:DinB family protein [Terracidiphilus sp.]
MRVLSLLAVMALAPVPVLFAQAPATPLPPEATANPMVWSAKTLYERDAKNMIAAAEQMPEDKYSYHPTADQWTFGKVVAHIAQSNGALCGALSDTTAPAALKVSDTASKAELVAGLKASFDFCGPVLDGLTDAKLGGAAVTLFHRTMPRAMVLMLLPVDLADHYSQMAAYLRLNGLTPPSAQPKK